MGNDCDYLHPVKREAGLFVRRTGEIVYEYSCSDRHPIIVKSTSAGWISVSTRVMQVEAPEKIIV